MKLVIDKIYVKDNILYLINSKRYSEFTKGCLLIKNNIPINAFLSNVYDTSDDAEQYKNIIFANPTYIDESLVENITKYKIIYLINLGINYISYISQDRDKLIKVYYSNNF